MEPTPKELIENALLERITDRCELFSLTSYRVGDRARWICEGVTKAGLEFERRGNTVLHVLTLADEVTK